MQEVIEEIETIEAPRLVHQQQRRQQRSSPQRAKAGSSCTHCTIFLLGLITLSLLAILALIVKDHFYDRHNLKSYIDIVELELDSSNYNKMSNLAAGTVIVTAKDGSKGVVEDAFFNIMMVCIMFFKLFFLFHFQNSF